MSNLTGLRRCYPEDPGERTCALLIGGSIDCWGLNLSGQLGDGTTTYDSDVSVPVGGCE